jgi:flavoprotein
MDFFEVSSIAFRIAGLTQPLQERTSILRKKFREEKDRSEWALLDSKGKRVLRWFGEEKPSEERIKKEEKRIQFFKHKNGSI